jgi:hypothetical protein
MSLATTGGGGLGGAGGGGGLIMAHPGGAVGRVAAPPQPAATSFTGTGTGAPPSAAVLGADLLDKNQLSLRQVKNVSHLPIVAIDLHGSAPEVAYFPKKPEDPSKGIPPISVGKISTDVALRPGEASHKMLRKFLAKSRGFPALKEEVLAMPNNGSKTTSSSDAIVITKPQCWLGLRRVADAPSFLRDNKAVAIDEDSSSPAISEEASANVGLTVTNSTIDGSPSNHDDYDRVVFKVRLCESKEAISILPEEAMEIVVQAGRYLVAAKCVDEHTEEEIADYPLAVALPAYAFADAAVDALSDALGNSGSIIVQRNVAALAGALLPSLDGKLTKILQRLNAVQQALHTQHQQTLIRDPAAIPPDDIMLLVIGMTPEGVETTAIQISAAGVENIACLFGNFRVIANVSYLDANPLSRLQQCGTELEAAMDNIAPEADGPAAVIFCGSAIDQKTLAAKWDSVKNDEWKNVPVFASAVDAIAKGCSVLAAVSHGRLSRIAKAGGGGSAKPRAELGIRVQNVAPVAVAVRMNYFGGQADKWDSEMKMVFDFDRQIPAGPYALDFKASEIAAHRSTAGKVLSDEDFTKEVKQFEGAKGIPLREEAALNFRIQVMQKWTRDGEWKPVGDIMEPLVKETTEKDGKTTKRDACEEVRLELTLGVSGMLTSSLIGERYGPTRLAVSRLYL